jgi:opacity protein-like surface antigen
MLLLAVGSTNSSLFAQTELNRVSIAERSDGAGFVLRYHLTAAPDSFAVARPAANLLQINIYGSRLSAEELPVDVNEQIEDIRLFDMENGVGADVYLNERRFFVTSAYPDVNGRDLLVSLEDASQEKVLETVTPGSGIERDSEGDAETDQTKQEQPEEVIDTDEIEAENEAIVRRSPAKVDGKKVTIGVLTGFSAADVKGDAFVSEVRQGISFGLAVGIQLPWVLPYNIGTGIETGINYAQKGFENPTPDFLNAQTVEFDYMEIPLLAKFSYPLLERVSPYILIGPSLGFNVSAERVRPNETRADLDDQTSLTDLSAMFGGGVDVKLNRQILSFQVKGGLSFSDVFNTVEEGPATDFFKHRYIALELVFRL